jgi:predicted hydrolase (HD superfamily)
VKKNELEKLQTWFPGYVAGFYTGGADDFLDKHVRLKEEHTARVCEEMRHITQGIGLSREDEHLAQATALLHDVGRFEQIRTYRTYVDPKSVNHGLLGVEVLDKEGVLKDLSQEEQTILKTSVQWHGAKALPEGLDERTALFCKLVRDADKLDVLGLLINNFKRYYDDPEHFDLEVEFPDRPQVSEHVIEALLRHELVDYRQIRTLHDAQMVLLGWVYDINFTATLRRIAQKQYLEQIAAFLPDLPEVRQAAEHVFRYVRERIAEKD